MTENDWKQLGTELAAWHGIAETPWFREIWAEDLRLANLAGQLYPIKGSVCTGFQSTPSHGGRLHEGHLHVDGRRVSIHALTRRATLPCFGTPLLHRVSIHALTRRATMYRFLARRRCIVSIHALTRRATVVSGSMIPRRRFNPRPHTEGDRKAQIEANLKEAFQSTPSHGGRLCPRDSVCHRGGVSIHALTRRATRAKAAFRAIKCFNPRPHTEGDASVSGFSSVSSCFNPRPHTEGDVVLEQHFGSDEVSIHALTRRATNPLY